MYILAFDVASFVEAFAERGHHARRFAGRSGAEKPDHRYCLLRAPGERPRNRAAEKQYEVAPSPVEHGASRALGDRLT